MAISVQMPALGESVTEGTVTRWLKQEGDTVAVDEPLLEVSTDKVDTEIPSPAAGVLTKIIAAEDDVVEVGGDLALIGEEGESADSGDSGDSGDSEESAPAEEAEPEPEPEPAAEEEAEEEAPAAAPAKPAASGGGDATSITMPELGESVTEGTVTRWLKKVGDEVAVDEALVEVSTDKVDTEIPSPVAGTLLSITAEEDDVVPVGGELAKIGSADAAPAASEPEPEPEPEPKEEPKEEPKPEPKAKPAEEAKPEPKPEPETKSEPKPEPKPAPAAESAPSGDGSPYVTPLVRKLASENGVDLNSVKGTGVGGRIRKQDVLAAAEDKKAPEPAAPRDIPLGHKGGFRFR